MSLIVPIMKPQIVTPSPGILTNLEASFEFENNVLDSHNSFDGTNINATYTSGKVGTCCDFNGTNAKITLPTGLQQTGAHTIEFWADCDNWGNMTYPGIYGGQHLTSVNFRGGIAISAYPSSLDRFFYQCHKDDGTIKSAIYYGISSITGWHHWVCTYDNDYLRIYLDGSLVVTSAQFGAFTIDWSGTYTSHQIGAADQANNGEKYFDGRLDCFRIWSRGVDSTEVSWLNNSGAGRTYAELVAA